MKQARYLFLVLLLLGCFAGSTQNVNLVAAYDCAQRNSMDSARLFMFKAMADSTTRKDDQAWYIKGFIYKELYKKYEKDNKLSPLRDTAIICLFKSVHLDSTTSNITENYKTAKFLAVTYYNDAMSGLDSLHYMDYAQSIKNFNKYRAYMMRIAPNTNFSATDVSFYLNLGQVYSYLYFHANPDKENIYLDSAKKAYNKVLDIDPNNIHANYQLAILYYNKATSIINRMDYDADIMRLNAAQDSSVNLMKMSLPYMLKTNNLDPCKKDAVKGLEGIYYLLHDTQKFEEFQQKLQQLENHQGNSPCK